MGRKRNLETTYIFLICICSILLFVVATVVTSRKRQQFRESHDEMFSFIQSANEKQLYRLGRAIEHRKSLSNKLHTPSEQGVTLINNSRSATEHVLVDNGAFVRQSLSIHIDTHKVSDISKQLIENGLSWKHTLSTSVEVVEEINGKMYRRRKHTGKVRMQAVDNCAIIGNGGVLLNSGCGAEIDAHDFVFRINMAPIIGFTDDVGRKVDFMSSNGQGTKELMTCLKSDGPKCARYRQTLGLLGSSYLWLSKYTSVNMNLLSAILEHVNATIVHPRDPLGDTIQKFWGTDEYPSSGLFVYSLASTICKRISLYGFYPFNQTSNGKKLMYNYYSQLGINEFYIGHDLPNEYHLLERLHQQRMLRLVTDICPSIGQRSGLMNRANA